MDEPRWVESEAVLDIHILQLADHGGLAGVRDAGLLESALHRPRNLWTYARDSADLAALAAAYAVGIARNHPFLDGNQRTAAVVCETFLAWDGHSLAASDDAWYDAMLRMAAGAFAEEDFALWLRERLAPRGE